MQGRWVERTAIWQRVIESSTACHAGPLGFTVLPNPCPTLQVLVLVSTDRLDRPLTIGQMQGKFQPVLLPQVGWL